LNVQIPNLKADQLVKLTRKISYSLGSACTSETLDPSHVLSAMGLSKSECFSSFRLSFSAEISKEEISFAKDIFRVAFQELNITE
jgi:cysteine desulfurase